jgi:hypothetical protein
MDVRGCQFLGWSVNERKAYSQSFGSDLDKDLIQRRYASKKGHVLSLRAPFSGAKTGL